MKPHKPSKISTSEHIHILIVSIIVGTITTLWIVNWIQTSDIFRPPNQMSFEQMKEKQKECLELGMEWEYQHSGHSEYIYCFKKEN